MVGTPPSRPSPHTTAHHLTPAATNQYGGKRESYRAAFRDVGCEGPSSSGREHCLRGRNRNEPAGKKTETKEMEKLTHLEALLFTAVLETCVDQLSILGYIMPVSYKGQTDLSHSGIQEMKEIVEALKELDSNYQESAKQGSRETVTSMSQKSIEHKQQLGKTEELKSTRHLSNRVMKNSALSIESLRKIQADRQYASDVITATMKRMQESGTFNSLTEANEKEEEKKSKFHDVLIREQEGKKQIKSLEKQLQDVKKQTETELKSRDAMILNLKDELQEIKAKVSMESSYVKKSTDLQVHETQKRCNNAENILDKEIQKLRSKTDEEIRVHLEIEDFLRQNHKKVQEKLEFWVDKYENDTDAKDKELDALKALKANQLEILQGLAKECQIFEKIIITHRAEEDAKRKQMEKDALELKSTLKLQSWWRGTMVRKNLGPYQGLKKMEKKKSDHKEKGKEEKAGAKKK
ncbi:dynein regulatory complex protein 9 [Melopsittacus undulatus]|uniref:dynein regulatory complex protein 9 n=1 Tax=Melopsittacus undulatus TaxID=13146 RepID=UPI00146D9C7A|nr:dynein regulatory complex protein 9 [Melopsittacus undulatus]